MRYSRLLPVLVLCLLMLASCVKRPADYSTVKPYGPAEWFMSDPAPEPLEVRGNPLDFSGAKLGIDPRNFELPRAHEGAYRLAARFPLIDQISNNPLYMKQWAEDMGLELQDAVFEGMGDALSLALVQLRGTSAYWPEVCAEYDEHVMHFAQQLEGRPFTPEFREVLESLFSSFAQGYLLCTKAVRYLSDDDRALLAKNPMGYLLPDGKRMAPLTGDTSEQMKYLEALRGIRYQYIFAASEVMLQAVERFRDAMGQLPVDKLFTEDGARLVLYRIQSMLGPVVIAGVENDLHEADEVLSIDLGGDDTYRNRAGGWVDIAGGASLFIDMTGNDRYERPAADFGQGFGFAGVGMLVDFAGDDTYIARHHSQGAGMAGVGLLWDEDGNDSYSGHGFVQAAGAFGLGMLIDRLGNDSYDGATLCQGGATTLGMGVLIDASGNDTFKLWVTPGKDALGGSPGYGQGGALSFRAYPWRGKVVAYGGAGLLLDCMGSDSYTTGGWCDQGGSYIMSLGALVDLAGNDRYKAGTGQGSGIHVTNAILVDFAGDDIYEGGFRCGGSGGDRSPGIFIDYAGNDRYISARANYGTGVKPFSFSLFIDYGGDDQYESPNPEGPITFNNWDSLGGVWPESEPNLWPYAMFLDLGGNDTYKTRNRANDSQRHSFGHGLFVDMEWKRGDVIGTVEPPLAPYQQLRFNLDGNLAVYEEVLGALAADDTFERFHAVRKAYESGDWIAPAIVQVLKTSTHRQLNRDLMEVLHYLLMHGDINDANASLLVPLLAAADREVREIMADNFGVWRLASGKQALLSALDDKEGGVRRFALSSLYAIDAQEMTPVLIHLINNDPSEDVRRVAVRFLTRSHGDYDPFELFVRVLDRDPSSAVKVAAAEGMVVALGMQRTEDAIAVLLRQSQGPDQYVRRACGKALCELGRVEGLDVLIESLIFPSIDAFYNYDYNVPNFIAGYAGYDLPEEKRYDREEWRKWLAANRDSINMAANAAAWRAYTQATSGLRSQSEEQQIEALEAFLAKYPGHAKGGRQLAGLLNASAWSMVTAPRGSQGWNPEKGLKYALRAVELVPDANYLDTLAEAYEANGMRDKAKELCREALKKYPGNSLFTERLKRM